MGDPEKRGERERARAVGGYRKREELLEILRSWLSHALDCVPSLPLITREQSLFVVGGMPKMLPTVTIMKNLIECVLFQGLGDFDHFFYNVGLLFCSPTSNNNHLPNQIPFDINISFVIRAGRCCEKKENKK